MGADAFSSWKSTLSTDEILAITKYTDNDHYQNINSVLRGVDDEFIGENAKIVDDLTEALSKSSLPENITLYRGTSTAMLGDLKNASMDDLIGVNITEGAFMSSSLSEDVAHRFADDLLLKIEAPAGSETAFIGNISEYSIEAEVLFNRGQKMIVKDAVMNEGVLELTVEILD